MNFEVERESIVQLLCRHYAQDRLTTEQLEARLDDAYRARTSDELRSLLQGLPDASLVRVEPANALDAGPREGRVLSVFAEVRKRGEWEPAPFTRAIAVFASLELDLREARIRAGVTTIDISATFAEVLVIVPPGLRVECDGSAILGEFTEKTWSGVERGADVAVVRITGMAIMGTVTVEMRLPGETAKEARRRERASR